MRENFERYIDNVEYHIYGNQEIPYKRMQYLNTEEKDTAVLNIMDQEDWVTHYKKIWNASEDENDKGSNLEQRCWGYFIRRNIYAALKWINCKAVETENTNIKWIKCGGNILVLSTGKDNNYNKQISTLAINHVPYLPK